MINPERIIKVNIDEEMKSSYIDYSMSVIVSRALPDVRDGLKPVHRRVLFGMNELGNNSDKPFKKSARNCWGSKWVNSTPMVIRPYMVHWCRLASPGLCVILWLKEKETSALLTVITRPAMRYTEARLRKIAEEMLIDINKDTVDFQFNFDDTLKEPVVLPARIPQFAGQWFVRYCSGNGDQYGSTQSLGGD